MTDGDGNGRQLIPTQVESLQKLQSGQFFGNTFDEVVVNIQRLKAEEVTESDVNFDETVLGEVHADDVAEIEVGRQFGRISLAQWG